LLLSANLVVACLMNSTIVAEAEASSANTYNPAISLILDGRYSAYRDDYALQGFQSAGEAGLPEKGFSLGHTELTFSANVDRLFSAYFNSAIAQEDGTTSVEMEEAYFQTLGLDNGFSIKGGRFYSGLGYLNSIHDHAHDFTDVPLVYAGIFGNHLLNTGVQGKWLAPTDKFLEFGFELTRGDAFPGGINEKANKGRSLFGKIGDDYSDSVSWQTGFSYYSSKFDDREANSPGLGANLSGASNALIDGSVNVAGLDAILKWAPQGNSTRNNWIVQMEYFKRHEKGIARYTENLESVSANYDGAQYGYYLQSVYQWRPQWRVGLRYDRLHANNKLNRASFNQDADGNATSGVGFNEFYAESALLAANHPHRVTSMVDWSPSEFSRMRLQFNKNYNGIASDNQIYFQYLLTVGAHGAHQF